MLMTKELFRAIAVRTTQLPIVFYRFLICSWNIARIITISSSQIIYPYITYFTKLVNTKWNWICYKIATDTGEEVLLVEEDYGDIIMLQLYVDGQYLGEYQMVEHYES